MSQSDSLKEERGRFNKNFDPFSLVGKRKGMIYRFISTKPINIQRKKQKGYVIVNGDEGKRMIEKNDFPDASPTDNTIRRGDLVLAMIPKEQYIKRFKENQKKARNLTKSAKQNFRKSARKVGVDTFEEG